MPTDRSLWVEDVYALRCRGCGERFAMFRRRHHCRRCGQVFCSRCLNTLPTCSPSQRFLSHVYEWFSPVSASAVSASSPSIPSTHPTAEKMSRATLGESATGQLSARLCRRCATNILENAMREASTPQSEFRPSSILTNGSSHALPDAPTPLSSSIPPRYALVMRSSPLHVSSKSTFPSDEHETPPPSLLRVAEPAQLFSTAALLNASPPIAKARHKETPEELEVTYSVVRVPRSAPSPKLTQWRRVQQSSAKKIGTALPTLEAEREQTGLNSLETTSTLIHVFSNPVEFSASFFDAGGAAWNSSRQGEGEILTSSGVHSYLDLSDYLCRILGSFTAACTEHLQARIQQGLREHFPASQRKRLSRHLASVAWHTMRRTAVALGASVLEHVSVFTQPASKQPAQCAVYPGLLHRRHLPCRRDMMPCENPRVLLLAGHLSYPVQPAEDLLDYVRSYSGYLDKLFQRLQVWHPDVIVVEGGMHHYLRKRIQEEGHMRLLLDVGWDVLRQTSWCLGADIIADLQYVGVGDLASTAPMGRCERFEVFELAEDEYYCGFRGFDVVAFHTLVLRGDGFGGPQWKAVEVVLKEAITVAFHLATQWQSIVTLTEAGAPPIWDATPQTKKEALLNAFITMNVGCRFPDAVYNACEGISGPAVVSALKDNIVVTVVQMDYLCGSGGGTGGDRSTTGVATGPLMSAVKSYRSLEVPLEKGHTRGSRAVTQGDAATSTASKSGNNSFHLSSLANFHFRPEPPGSSAYAVVQKKAALSFYGDGDESLFNFLVGCFTGSESHVLYLHGGYRVRVLTTACESDCSNPGATADRRVDPATRAAQTAAFHKVAAQQRAAKSLTSADTPDAREMAASLAHLNGHFSLRVRAGALEKEMGGVCWPVKAAVEEATEFDAQIPVCPAHLLNMSTAAFVEWILHGWMLALHLPAGRGTLSISFQFHVSPTAQTPQQNCSGALSASMNTVTFLVQEISLLTVTYPPATLPPSSGIDLTYVETKDAASNVSSDIVDSLYADREAKGMLCILGALRDAMEESLLRTRSSEDSSTGSSPLATVGAFSTAESILASTPPTTSSSPPLLGTQTFIRRLRMIIESTEGALTALSDARARGKRQDLLLILGGLRRHVLPSLITAYCSWSIAQHNVAGMEPSGTFSAAALFPLRELDGCLFHSESTQWIRLAEPSSIVSAVLHRLYGVGGGEILASSLVFATATEVAAAPTSSTGQTNPTSQPLESAATSPHVKFDVESKSVLSGSAQPQQQPEVTGFLSQVGNLTRTAAFETLRRCRAADSEAPVSLKCVLAGYKPVLASVRGGGAGYTGSSSAINGITGISGNNGSAEVSITVDVLFPHEFAALHVLYTDGEPFDICAALLRCQPYTTEGGKSQSRFYVTCDGRFLLKSVKPTELRYFREWAPRYFSRMADYYESLTPQRSAAAAGCTASGERLFCVQPTLGKVLGLYAVLIQGARSRSLTVPPASPSTVPGGSAPPPQQALPLNILSDGVHCFMVSEQLLFHRPVRETWDLKGSQRNRSTESTAAVRLDVDLVQQRLRHGNFFFCTPEAKSFLMDHLSRDTALLAESGIMDYSLMTSVGEAPADSGESCVYVGMIDFLHPYSSSKVLESKVKSGLDTMLGHARRDPTIIDPASYAARFMQWMDGYFNGVPDRLFTWTRVNLLKERCESGLADKKNWNTA